MKRIAIAAAMAALGWSGGQAAETFSGTISDAMCATAGHAQMRMGPTDAECTRACVDAHGAAFVIVAGKNVYTLNGQQQALEKLAGQKVKIVGTLNARTQTIQVDSVTAEK